VNRLDECRRQSVRLFRLPIDARGRVSLQTNADDRLPRDPLGLDPPCRVQGGYGVIEGRDVADVRAQSSVPHPLDDLTAPVLC
jgi:hypothetical protein